MRGASRIGGLGSAARGFRRRPGFSIAAVGILAVSIAATGAAFSVASATLEASGWWEDEDRAVLVWPNYQFSRGQLDWLRRTSTQFDVLGGIVRQPGIVRLDDRSITTRLAILSPELFVHLRSQPVLGRGLLPEDAVAGSEPVAVIGHSLWRSAFAGDEGVVGMVAEVNGERRRVIGVMPAGAEQPGPRTEVWVPLVMNAADPDFWPARELALAGILRPGVSVAMGQEDIRGGLQALARRFAFFFRPDFGLDATVIGSAEQTWGTVSTPLLLLFAGTWLLLLVAGIDVGNLAVGRSIERRVELRVRMALGATRRRVVREIGLEAATHAVVAGVLGWAGAAVIAPAIARVFPLDTHVVALAPASVMLIAFVAVLTLAAWGLMTGVPSLHFLSSTRTMAPTRGLRGSAPPWLVVAQAALSMVLLVTAVLLFRTVGGLKAIPLGFDPADRVAVAVAPFAGDPGVAGAEALRDEVAERVRGAPGIVAAGWISAVPLLDPMTSSPVNVEDEPAEVAVAPRATAFVVDEGALDALGIGVLSGRGFDTRDGRTRPRVALASRSMAERLWPDRDPIGRRIAVDPHDWQAWITVVGVVEDTRHTDLTGPVPPAYYLPRAQSPAPSMSLVARSAAGAGVVTRAVRSALADVAPGTPAGDGVALGVVVRDARGPAQVLMALLMVLAGLATVLGAVGLYGALVAWVGRRRTEIGTRLALGATPAGMTVSVLRSGLLLTATGIAIGLVGGAMAGQLIRGLLFGTSALDPLAFGLPAVLLLLTALVAALAPALRAARIPPAEAMRGAGR